MDYFISCLTNLHNSGRFTYKKFIIYQFICILLTIVASITTIVFPNLISKIIDDGIVVKNIINIKNIGIQLVCIGFLSIFFQYLYQLFFCKFSQRLILELKLMIFETVLKTNIKFWSNHASGDIFKIIEDDIISVEAVFTKSFSNIISNFFMAMFVSVYIIHTDILIGTLLIILTFLVVFIQRYYGKRMEQLAYKVRTIVADAASFTNEALNKITSIQMSGFTKNVEKKFKEKNTKVYSQGLVQIRMILLIKSIVHSYSILGILIVMLFGAYGVLQGSLTIGKLIALTMYIQWLFGPISALGNAYLEFKMETALAESHQRVVKEPLARDLRATHRANREPPL